MCARGRRRRMLAWPRHLMLRVLLSGSYVMAYGSALEAVGYGAGAYSRRTARTFYYTATPRVSGMSLSEGQQCSKT